MLRFGSVQIEDGFSTDNIGLVEKLVKKTINTLLILGNKEMRMGGFYQVKKLERIWLFRIENCHAAPLFISSLWHQVDFTTKSFQKEIFKSLGVQYWFLFVWLVFPGSLD